MEDDKIKNQLISEIDKLKQIVEGYKESQPNFEKLSRVKEESAEQYETLINTAPFGIITLDENGIVTSCNKKVLNFLGQSEREIIGKHFTKIKFLSAEDITRYLKIFAYALGGKEGISFEISGQDKDGNIFFGEVFYGLIKRDGSVKAIQILINNITKRKEAEEKLNYLRFHDDLTSLFSRAYFEEEIKRQRISSNLFKNSLGVIITAGLTLELERSVKGYFIRTILPLFTIEQESHR